MDPLVTSATYSSEPVQKWLEVMSSTEYFWNAITAVIAPDLFRAGCAALPKLLGQTRPTQKSVPLSRWPSIFSGLELIVNRVTLSHRDPGGAPSHYDMLVSLGIGHDAIFGIEDVGAELVYSPGTMVYIAGKVRIYYLFSHNHLF